MNTPQLLKLSIYTILLFSSPSWAQDKNTKDSDDILKTLEYPELMVTPRASERIIKEEQLEAVDSWINFIPYQTSAILTLWSGLSISSHLPTDASKTLKKDAQKASAFISGLGRAWLLTTTIMAFTYRPYRRTLEDIKTMPKKTRRQQLARERLAEEGLSHAYRMGQRLTYLSVTSNLMANLFVVFAGRQQAQITGGIGVLMSFAPIIFRTRWELVFNKHQDYKKKIYGPVGFLIPHQLKDGSYETVPGVSFNVSF